MAFIQAQFRTAAWFCKQVQQMDARNVKAHVILGDIYRIQRRPEEAISMYSIAAQLDPRDADIQAKLNRMLKHGGSGDIGERRAALKMGLNLMGWSMIAFLLLLLYMNPGEPIPWLRMNVSFVSTVAEYMHGLWHDVQIRVGPEHLPLPQLRRRMAVLAELFPPNQGYSVFAKELEEKKELEEGSESPSG